MPSRESGEREHGRLPPEDLRGRDRRQSHRLDLDIGTRLISVDLEEHVTDAQGRALLMGDDDLDLLHVGDYRGDHHQRDGEQRPAPRKRTSVAMQAQVQAMLTTVTWNDPG